MLVTTADAAGGRSDALARLIVSVARFKAARPGTPVEHHLLLQRCTDLAAACDALGIPAWMTTTAIDRQVPLSAARNIMLDAVLSRGLADDALVAFPDDDAWYPAGTLEHVADRFAGDDALELWLCRYGADARFDAAAVEHVAGLQQVLSFGSSNTIMLRGALLKAIGGFDERLGLGTPARSGEDTEFAVRAHLAARRTRFVSAKLVGHRDFSRAVRARYYGGSLVAIARHAHRTMPGLVALARKLAVGAALVARGELKPGELASAFALVVADRRNRAGTAALDDRPSSIRTPRAAARDAIAATAPTAATEPQCAA